MNERNWRLVYDEFVYQFDWRAGSKEFVVVGDFNCPSGTAMFPQDASLVRGCTGWEVDYIVGLRGLTVHSRCDRRLQEDSVELSDHALVSSCIELAA